jgi:spore coat protein U-like protein
MKVRAYLIAALTLAACVFHGTASAQVVTGTVDATITLENACEVNGAPGTTGVDFGTLDFGTHPTLFTQADSEISDSGAGISVQCTPGTQYTMSFDGGLYSVNANAALGLRALEDPVSHAHVTYNLYDLPARVTPLSINGSIGPLTADGSVQTVNVYGRALGETGLVAGTYADTIGVTLTF